MDEKKVSPSPSPPVQHEEAITPNGHHRQPRHYRDTTAEGQPAYEEHGALIDHKVPQEDVVQSHPDLAWSRVRHYLRDPFSEFFGKRCFG
jgi:aquaglyceroporin related protein, other eukaryote